MKPQGFIFDKFWREQCEVVEVKRQDVDRMIKTHYLKKWPGVCVLILAMRIHGHFVGTIVYALPPAQTCVRYGGETWELARLWLEDWMPKNAETWLIGKSVKWIRQKHPTVHTLVSYADPSFGHQGTIYKAANWQIDGRTDDDRKSPRVDYADAITGKIYSRRSHVPIGTEIKRVSRVSKFRYVYRLR